jgi:predicted ribosomally synthesized peptide with SipW-like signal peptide
MNKLLVSILTIGVVSVAAFGASRAFFSDTEASNGNTFQAGTLNLTIKSECSYNGSNQTCSGAWSYKDLSNDKFFNFTDLKPGDIGENTISFNVTNDAWMCASLKDAADDGKLSKYMNVFWWVDADGNNIYNSGEKILYDGPRTLTSWFTLAGGLTLPLTFADSYMNWTTWPTTPGNTVGIPMNTPQHLGVGWCFGTLTVPGTGPYGFTCDGTNVLNDAQGGTFVGDMSFYIEQQRNNPTYRCLENVDKLITTP